MTVTKQAPQRSHGGAAWLPAWTIAVALAGFIIHADLIGVSWWMPLLLAPVGGGMVLLAGAFGETPARAIPHRLAATAAAAAWTAYVGYAGVTSTTAVVLAVGAVVVALLEVWLAAGSEAADTAGFGGDRRPAPVRDWEGLLNRLARRTKAGEQMTVRQVTGWPARGDGEQVHVDLPEDMTAKDVADLCDRIAAARRLPQGCVVRVLDGEHQGTVTLDVMLRDCLADTRTVDEPTTAASIYDEFDAATSPRGEPLTVCLREKSMVVGGTVGSGKTTLLHRLIMFLARCTDTLIWVVDLNGGGVAAPWIAPWARGEAEAPVVDWVADNEAEAAVMLAVAKAVAKDRKTSKEAARRKRAANTTVLPVDAQLPAFVVITDEGGEVRQAAGLLGLLAQQGISRLAQIARAEGGRVVMSVLRGTADLLDKSLRAVVGVRICLRMEEEGEYDHVLGVNPGRARLLHIGSAYVYRTDTDYRPVLARTVDVDLASIERHAAACAHLRPMLDDRARRVAARVTVSDVLDGRDPRDHYDIARLPVMRDVEEGRAYEGRWDRKAAMLAELRGEDVPDDDDERPRPVIVDRPTVAPPGSAAERLLLGTGITLAPTSRQPEPAPAETPAERRPVGDRDVDAEAAALLSAGHLALVGVREVGIRRDQPSTPATAREVILLVLRDAHPDPLRLAQVRARMVDHGCEVSTQRVHELLTKLVDKGQVRQVPGGYELVRDR